MGNYGTKGIEETRGLLAKNGILSTGISGPVYLTVKGKRLAFLGYNDIGTREDMISWADKDVIGLEVSEAGLNADIVVVMFHWGAEYVRQPGARQKELARLTVDSGADLVLGNHPHWIQPLEIYNGKLIIYAHGNTVFDQMWSEDTKYGVIGKYVFFDDVLIDVEYHPSYIKNYGQPDILSGEAKKRILKLMLDESNILLKSSSGSGN